MTGSAVFFTQIVGLSAAQVGLGLTCAGMAAFLVALPMGKLVDRFGPRKMWAVSATGQAAMFAVWPFITDFRGYVAMAVGMEVIGALGGAAHGAYTIDVLPPDERVKSRAYMYSALNVGFTLGSLIGGFALAFHSNDVLHALPWFTAVAFLVNAAAITRLPRASHDDRTPEDRKVKVAGPGPLRNPGWLLTTMHTVRLVNAATPHLERSSAASIVAISSVSGRESDFASGPYGTAKTAIVGYIHGLSLQLAGKGIRANTVSPGNTYFDGGVWSSIETGNPELFNTAVNLNPTGHMGTCEEIADPVVFLSSPRASRVSGTNLVVDGALTRGIQL